MSNPFTRALSAKLHNRSLAEFVQHWDALEQLIMRVYRAKSATLTDEAEWHETRAWLGKHLPHWQPQLHPHWQGKKIGGQPADRDPFAGLIQPTRAADFAENLRAMQTLPAAREALNLLVMTQQNAE